MCFRHPYNENLKFVFAAKCASRTTIGWLVCAYQRHFYEENPQAFLPIPNLYDHAYSDIRRLIVKEKLVINPNDIVFCIKRDPIKRFVSAYENMRKFRNCSDLPRLLNNWERSMQKPVLKEHFRTQTSYYGSDKSIFTHIFNHSNMNEVKDFLEDVTNTKLPDLHLQQSGAKEKTILTETQVEWIKEKYSIDYENGWY